MKKFNFLEDFFNNFPALYSALFFLIGICTYFYNNIFLLLFALFIWSKKSFVFAFVSFFFAILYCSFFFADTKKITKPIDGIGHFKISSIKEGHNFKNRYYIYKGTLKKFETPNQTYRNINCLVFAKKKYSSDNIYIIAGELFLNSNFHFHLKTKNHWIKDKRVYNLVQKRHLLKQKFFQYLKKSIKDKNSAIFLHTLITGVNASTFLSNSFSKIGLQHVIAISGFHFGIFTLFFSFFLRIFFPKKFVVFILLIMVNLYFLFIGPLISVQRAYLMIQIALIAQIINRRYFALNALGISVIVILMLDPLSITNVGFQLSFLCSFAILIGFPLIDDFLDILVKKRSYLEKKELNYISKIGDKVFIFIRQSLCLSIAVNIFILPVILYHFHKFAYLSFIYNLYIPSMVGISMILVIFGLIFNFIIPPLGFVINYINSFFTKFILQLITYPPASMEFYLRYQNVSFEFVIIYLVIISMLFLFIRHYTKQIKTPEYCHFI